MKVILTVGKGLLKALVLGFVFAGTFVMNCIGAIICAVTE